MDFDELPLLEDARFTRVNLDKSGNDLWVKTTRKRFWSWKTTGL